MACTPNRSLRGVRLVHVIVITHNLRIFLPFTESTVLSTTVWRQVLV